MQKLKFLLLIFPVILYGSPLTAQSAEDNYNKAAFFADINKKDAYREHLTRAANRGHKQAALDLGIYFLHTGSDSKAKQWLKTAADLGSGPAFAELANIYEREQNYVQAFNHYRSAVKKGYGEVYHKLGEFYEYGNFVAKDQDEARLMYWKSAMDDQPAGNYKMGYLHYHGSLGAKRDYKSAASYLRKSIELSNQELILNPVFDLAQAYHSGKFKDGTHLINYEMAAKLYLLMFEAFDALNKNGPQAYINTIQNSFISELIEDLMPAPEAKYFNKPDFNSMEQLVSYYHDLAEQGHFPSMIQLGDHYESAGNYEAAQNWYNRAANLDTDFTAYAKFKMALCYRKQKEYKLYRDHLYELKENDYQLAEEVYELVFMSDKEVIGNKLGLNDSGWEKIAENTSGGIIYINPDWIKRNDRHFTVQTLWKYDRYQKVNLTSGRSKNYNRTLTEYTVYFTENGDIEYLELRSDYYLNSTHVSEYKGGKYFNTPRKGTITKSIVEYVDDNYGPDWANNILRGLSLDDFFGDDK